jgi:diketogulonate reductase-like aldo/keto reductase
VVAEAIKSGYRLIDTSGDYGTQPGVGQGVIDSGISRQQIYLATKVEETDNAYQATHKNLQELQTDYANLMLIHRPPPSGAGLELWEGLIRAQNDGLAKDIGVSNYSAAQIQKLIDATGEVPVVNQIEWTPFGHSLEMLEYCREQSIIIQAYSPLGRSGVLDDPMLKDLATMYLKTPAQIVLRWCLQLGVVPLPKANKIEHVRENFQVFDFELNPDDMATLNGLNHGYSAFGKLPYV